MQPPLHLPVLLPPIRAHLAVIDLGTNAIRLQIARVYEDGTYQVASDLREPARLGEALFTTGSLSRAAIERAIDTLKVFVTIARKHQVEALRCVATSAVREAANGESFVQEATELSGVPIEVISGEREAHLIARGILSELSEPLRRRKLALVDLGGGSTEISIVEKGKLLQSVSLPLGSVRLTQLHLRSDPLTAEEEVGLRKLIRDTIRARELPARDTIAGSAGTIGALANYIRTTRLAQSSDSSRRSGFSPIELAQATLTLKGQTALARRSAPGIHEFRADAIVSGAIILEEICTQLGAKWIRPMRRGLRDGAMVELIESVGLLGPRIRKNTKVASQEG